MTDKGRITAGLLVFLVVVTSPVWYTFGPTGDAALPDLELPKDSFQCVEHTEYMAANHMDLLNHWQDAVVREGKKVYTSEAFGTQHEMSLTRTCMNCHSNRETFCARCHDYVNVQPLCWDCHIESKGN